MIHLTTGTPASGMSLNQCWSAQQGKTCGTCETHDVGACWSTTAPASICSPPVKKTDSACSLAVPADSGQAGGIPHRSPIISVSFKCPDFGTNSAGVRLSEWPRYRRFLGKRRILSAYLIGSLV